MTTTVGDPFLAEPEYHKLSLLLNVTTQEWEFLANMELGLECEAPSISHQAKADSKVAKLG